MQRAEEDEDSLDSDWWDSDYEAAESDDDLFAANVDKDVVDNNEPKDVADMEDDQALDDEDVQLRGDLEEQIQHIQCRSVYEQSLVQSGHAI